VRGEGVVVVVVVVVVFVMRLMGLRGEGVDD